MCIYIYMYMYIYVYVYVYALNYGYLAYLFPTTHSAETSQIFFSLPAF